MSVNRVASKDRLSLSHPTQPGIEFVLQDMQVHSKQICSENKVDILSGECADDRVTTPGKPGVRMAPIDTKLPPQK